MKAYINQLKAQTEAANRQREQAEAKKRRNVDPRVLCDKPMTIQIEELMWTLSPAQRDRPWSMDDLVTRLNGRYRNRPHPMRVGEALRALGWTSKRLWGDGGGRRAWLPPAGPE